MKKFILFLYENEKNVVYEVIMGLKWNGLNSRIFGEFAKI